MHVAKEMTREGFDLPLLIGGATTSKAHTAVKIAPAYAPSVVHVLDASRAVGVVGRLVNTDCKADFAKKVRPDYDQMRQMHQDKGAKTLLDLWRGHEPIDYSPIGLRSTFRLLRLLGVEDRSQQPLMHQLIPTSIGRRSFTRGNCRDVIPAIFEDHSRGSEGQGVVRRCTPALLRRDRGSTIIDRQWGVRVFPCQQRGRRYRDCTADPSRTQILTTYPYAAQQMEKPEGQSNLALADFVAPQEVRPGRIISARLP